MKVAITGASGFLGGALASSLATAGDRVVRIGRGVGSDLRWGPTDGALDPRPLEGVDAVVNSSGSTIGVRWTAAARHEIRESRVRGTRLLAEACARLRPLPEVLICASAIGIYGDRGDEWLNESSSLGSDFLAELTREWERAADPAREAGMRVVHVRNGLVLDPAGGVLAKLLLPFRLGIGGPMGSGRQWMSWISREDQVRAMHHLLRSPGVSGPVNATAPEPVTNATFAAILGRELHRPAFVPVPSIVLSTVFGEMARGTILASQRVRPSVLEATGFRFLHPTLTSALRFGLGAR